MARGLAKEIENRGRRPPGEFDMRLVGHNAVHDPKHTRVDSNKVPLRSIISDLHGPGVAQGVGTKCQTHTRKIYLPDITGLTSVVGSPVKAGLEYVPYSAKEDVELGGECNRHPAIVFTANPHPSQFV